MHMLVSTFKLKASFIVCHTHKYITLLLHLLLLLSILFFSDSDSGNSSESESDVAKASSPIIASKVNAGLNIL